MRSALNEDKFAVVSEFVLTKLFVLLDLCNVSDAPTHFDKVSVSTAVMGLLWCHGLVRFHCHARFFATPCPKRISSLVCSVATPCAVEHGIDKRRFVHPRVVSNHVSCEKSDLSWHAEFDPKVGISTGR